ncbi:MAG: hypothetical protein IPO53_10615 [Chitinophagaceae bacterium]|nr:hypothetical protein [Chitinophagaceae bacterium]
MPGPNHRFRTESQDLPALVKLWVELGDIPSRHKSSKSFVIGMMNFRGWSLGDIAEAQLEANDFEGAKKPLNISFKKNKSLGLLTIAEFQLNKADTAGAKKNPCSCV